MQIEIIKNSKTEYIGKDIIYYKEIGSTHDMAIKLIKEGISNGSILIADKQTKGRGTKTNKWYTGEAKNIAMTIILFPKCNVKDLEGLTVAIAECMQKTIKSLYNYELYIKLPNDLYLNGKKISGILTQISSRGEKIEYLLISIGFNVNEENFGEDTKNIATSLKKEYGKDYSREDIISKFIENLEKKLNLIKNIKT